MPDYRLKKQYTFQIGERLRAEDGDVFTIEGFLGRGGQGEVYKVRSRDGQFALKWYHADRYLANIDAEAFHRNLVRNVENGVPRLSNGHAADQFIWPIKMVCRSHGSFGYVMNLFPQGYVPLKNIILGQKKDPYTGLMIPVRWGSWFARVTAALNIVRAFEILHARGLNYQDLNDGGFFIHPQTGKVVICDCDNVSPEGKNLGIRGMMTFMAPEVVREEKLPDRSTDEFSLAVILFRLFLYGHPLVGRRSHELRSNPDYTDEQIDNMIFGTAPRYCLHPTDKSNRADPVKEKDVLQHCRIYPDILMNAFQQVFTLGIRDTSKRLTATDWRKLLIQVRDHLLVVDGKEQFFSCHANAPLPPLCRKLCYVDGTKALCIPDKVLYAYHFDRYSGDFSTVIGRIIPTNRPDSIGMINTSDLQIRYTLAERTGVCGPGQRIPLLPGMVLEHNGTKVQVK